MNKVKFVFWNFWKNFKKDRRRWLTTGIVTFCGLLLINVTIMAVFIGNTYINANFIENNSLRWIEVQKDGAPVPLRQIVRNTDNRITLLPRYEAFMSGVEFEDYDNTGKLTVSMSPNSMFVPFEALDFFGIDTSNISKEAWDAGQVVLVSPFEAERYGLQENQLLTVPFSKAVFNNEFHLSNEELSSYVEQINQNPMKVTVKIREITTLPRYQNYSLLPIQLLYNQYSRVNSITEEAFIANEELTAGFYIIVKDFADVDKVADEYKSKGYTLEYALESFQNLSAVLSNVQMISNYFIILVVIIICVTFINNFTQILYHRKHEIGLQQALGLSKKSLIMTTLLEFLFQNMLVMIAILPTIIVEWFIVSSLFQEELAQISAATSILFVWGVNWIVVLVISLVGSTLPLFRTFRLQIVRLLNSID